MSKEFMKVIIGLILLAIMFGPVGIGMLDLAFLFFTSEQYTSIDWTWWRIAGSLAWLWAVPTALEKLIP